MENPCTRFHLVYKTSVTPFFPICLIAKCYSEAFKEPFKSKVASKELAAIISKGSVSWFFDKSLHENAKHIFTEFYLNAQLIEQVKREEVLLGGKLFAEIKIPAKALFTEGTLNPKGEAKLRRIFQYYSEYGGIVDVPGFLFQVYLVDEFKKELFSTLKGTPPDKEKVFNLLLSSGKLTNFERFLSSIQNCSPGYAKRAAAQHYWVVHDYLGDIIDDDYSRKKRKEYGVKRITKQLLGAEERIIAVKKAIHKLNPAMQAKAALLQDILYLYNERKKQTINQVNIFIRRVVELAIPGITFEQIHQLYQHSPEEIIEFLKGKPIFSISERENLSGYSIKNGEISHLPKEMYRLIDPETKVKELKGSCAYAGKVRGRARLIINHSHMHKFKDGEILVAPFTNVSYMPIMSRAKAILTETGGLTSHAAIVSRELKKPCIVGIKNLLLVLRDGDMVEVDSKKGVVRKITSKNNNL